MRHNVSILFVYNDIRTYCSLKGATCYNEARAWMNKRISDMAALGYTVKAFSISQLRVQ